MDLASARNATASALETAATKRGWTDLLGLAVEVSDAGSDDGQVSLAMVDATQQSRPGLTRLSIVRTSEISAEVEALLAEVVGDGQPIPGTRPALVAWRTSHRPTDDLYRACIRVPTALVELEVSNRCAGWDEDRLLSFRSKLEEYWTEYELSRMPQEDEREWTSDPQQDVEKWANELDLEAWRKTVENALADA